MTTRIIEQGSKITLAELKVLAEQQFGEMVKAVVDIARVCIGIGGELHADIEELLLEHGSKQGNLWGINLYPGKPAEKWLEFDSMINIRPSQGNRSREVEDLQVREKIVGVVNQLIDR